ncbi:hypothetical protein DH2020_042456 [Rehmannia glutinosa]|uniref:Ribulose bisphosphate carboxylase/oxygenase activase, chloroplastic n=1 Tax=Rehmannia glutinosa TaxID=99300 RepID=A0ABR0UN86_REHGL
MALCFQISPSLIKSQFSCNPFNSQFASRKPSNFLTICCSQSEGNENPNSNAASKQEKKLSEQSSWESKDSEGKDYLYRLGAEADNMNIAVGARAGVIDDLFTGNFLGKDSDIVFDYRQKATRSFEYLQGDYYIAPAFMDKVVCHIVKNYIAHLLNAKVPLILGIWGGKGQGKTFQTELIFRALGVEPIIMSAGELESERAGEPGKLIRERYRTASQVVQNQCHQNCCKTFLIIVSDCMLRKMSCLMINDIDAGLGRFVDKIPDMYFSVSTPRQPTQDDIVNIVQRMYEKDGITRDEVVSIVSKFPNQALDFYGALRSRTYDRSILKWVNDAGGAENLGSRLFKQKKDGKLPVFTAPKQTLEALLESGYDLIKEQKLIMESKLSKEYMKNMDD